MKSSRRGKGSAKRRNFDDEKEMASKELREDAGLSAEDRCLLSVFDKANVVLKVGSARLHVKKEHLMAQYVVFKKMFNSDFKKAKTIEISFPEKDLLTFTRFLQYLLPGFQDQLEENIVHDILPLVKEYQTDSLLKRIDTMLADITKTEGDTITTDMLIQNILEAEQYDMPEYLNECIDVASNKMYERLSYNLYFSDVTQDTQFKICKKRISLIDWDYKANQRGFHWDYKANQRGFGRGQRRLNQYMINN